MAEYMFLLRTKYPNNTKHSTVPQKTKEGKKMYLGSQIFFEKEETKETRAHFSSFISRARALDYSCSFSVEQKKRTRNNVGWNAVRAPSHAEGTKNAFSLFLSHVYVLFDACFYDNEKKRDVCLFFPTTNVVFFRRRRRKLSISALTSLSDLMIFFSKR
jgi:hypothetical protein